MAKTHAPQGMTPDWHQCIDLDDNAADFAPAKHAAFDPQFQPMPGKDMRPYSVTHREPVAASGQRSADVTKDEDK